MYIVLYRWKLRPGSERGFIEAWSRVSRFLKTQRGSLGSRLHRGSDGIWYSYAQWPDAATRKRAFAGESGDAEALAVMRQAIAEGFPEVELETQADFLTPSAAAESIPSGDKT